MMKISVFEILNSPNAMFHQDGLKLHTAITDALKNGETRVVVDFSSVTVLTTQFLNASFGKIMMENDIPYFVKVVEVVSVDHLSSYKTKIEWVTDNIKNDDNYGPIYSVVLA